MAWSFAGMSRAAAASLFLTSIAFAAGGAPAQLTATCKDGTTFSGTSRTGACARHGGVQEWGATSGSSSAAATAPSPSTAGAPSSAAGAAATTNSAAEGRFATGAAAKAHCPTDTVVWVNPSSKIYHFVGSPAYGHTKAGTYMCEKETSAAGFRAAKNEKHP